MGSYLSIVNNTPNEWHCRIGPDEAALNISGVIIGVIGTAAAVLATAGTAAPLAASLAANGVVSVFGVSTSALATVTGAAASLSGVVTATGAVSTFGITIAKGINDNLISKGFNKLAAGESHRYGKMSLSLWQQAMCVRTYVVNEYTVRTETVFMRPIFSGSTADSNRNHDIQWWINKNGVEFKDVVAQRPGNGGGLKHRALEGGEVIVVKAEDVNTDELEARDFSEGDVIVFTQ